MEMKVSNIQESCRDVGMGGMCCSSHSDHLWGHVETLPVLMGHQELSDVLTRVHTQLLWKDPKVDLGGGVDFPVESISH